MADREKLIELLEDVQRCGEDYTDYEIYGMRIPDTVSNEEVADHLISHGVTVRERGRWVGQRCSICDESYMDYADADSYPAIGEPKPYFCPNCGADMRGEEDGNET